jgi:predicted N-formylglutamate amidohydrolase
VTRPHSPSPFFFTCDHASNRIPVALGELGLPAHELARHIAWDIGALGVATLLAEQFDATLVASGYSRLVIDCNRHLWRDDAIPVCSEWTEVPGNRNLSESDKAARQTTFHRPYHAQIEALVDARQRAARAIIYVAVHSFTPVYRGESRPWQIAMLSNRDRRLSDILLRELKRDAALCVGDNIPYRLTDEGDYGVPVHAERRGLPHVLIELRQDEIAEPAGQRAWAQRLRPLLQLAAREIGIDA